MARYTLADARAICAPHVDGGSCDNTLIDARINEAISRVLDVAPWYEIMRNMRLMVCKSCIALPSAVESIIAANINGVGGFVFNSMYQYLHSGPGDMSYKSWSSGYKDLADMGDHFHTMFDVPKAFNDPDDETTVVEPQGLPLIAFSTAKADEGRVITVTGIKYNGEQVTEEVTIRRWKGGVEGDIRGTWGDAKLPLTTALFHEVGRVRKPVTEGYVTMYAVHVSTKMMFALAKYTPQETEPRFRRYAITNGGNTVKDIQLRVRLRFQPLSDPEDLIPFEQLHTVKLAVMAISEENAKSWEHAQTAFAQAVGLLLKREEAKVTSSGNPVIMDSMSRASYAHRMKGIGVI